MPTAPNASIHNWPEPRPSPWRTLAAIDQRTHISSLFGTQLDAILLYHSVGGVPGTDYRWDLPTEVFREQIQALASRFEIVDLEQLIEEPDTTTKRVAITFDDGFQNVFKNAVPILREFRAPATVFCCPSYINDDNITRLRKRHDMAREARNIVMTDSQIQALVDDPLFKLGNHTLTHPDLTEFTDEDERREEILGGKRALEDRFDVTIDRFAYPYGKFDDAAMREVMKTHNIAVSSEPSLIGSGRNAYRLPRLDGCQPTSVLCFEVSDISHRLRMLMR